MQILIKFSPPYSMATDREQIQLAIDKNCLNVLQLIDELVKLYPQLKNYMITGKKGSVIPIVTVNSNLANMDSLIGDGDTVRFLFPLSGG